MFRWWTAAAIAAADAAASEAASSPLSFIKFHLNNFPANKYATNVYWELMLLNKWVKPLQTVQLETYVEMKLFYLLNDYCGHYGIIISD